MATKLLNILLLFSIALLVCIFTAAPSNALSVDTLHAVRHLPRNHDAIAKRKRASAKRCKHRSSSAAPQPTQPPKSHKPQSNTGGSGAGNGGSGKPASGGGHASGGGKRGLAWPNGDTPTLSSYKTSSVSWLYTWSPNCPSKASSLGFNCVPMLWGDRQIGAFKSLVKGGYANTVLGPNEPNEPGQSNMSPSHGADLWKQYIQPLKAQGYQLIAPATSSNPNGKTWLKNFFSACNSCTFDGLAMHWYDTEVNLFIQYVEDFHNTFGLDLWVTEYACQSFNAHPQCSKDQTFSFHQQVMDFMDKTPYVAHYSPFGFMLNMQGVNPDNQLMGPNGPTALGDMFLGK